jgi:hypothetical protein
LDIEVVPTANLVCHALHEDRFLGEDPRVLRVGFEGLHESIFQPSGAYNWKKQDHFLIFCRTQWFRPTLFKGHRFACNVLLLFSNAKPAVKPK